jgi:hypothetical protein
MEKEEKKRGGVLGRARREVEWSTRRSVHARATSGSGRSCGRTGLLGRLCRVAPPAKSPVISGMPGMQAFNWNFRKLFADVIDVNDEQQLNRA